MSWLRALYDTYELCAREPRFTAEEPKLLPVNHSSQQAQIEIVLDQDGHFRRARVISKEETLIPVTESSASRTSGVEPHPLADKIKYVAGDFSKFGGKDDGHFERYTKQLEAWCSSPFSNPKARAILNYVNRRTTVQDLVSSGILTLDSSDYLSRVSQETEVPPVLFRYLTKKEGGYDQGEAFVRWVVEQPDVDFTRAWEDPDVIASWVQYCAHQLAGTEGDSSKFNICALTGSLAPIAKLHPKRIRHAADGGKLISANDSSGYTFRGRFTDVEGIQACSIGSIATQKAHNALRWLIARQGVKNGEQQVYISWSPTGNPIPNPFLSTFELFSLQGDAIDVPDVSQDMVQSDVKLGDVGQTFALKLNKMISGYCEQLASTDGVVVLGLDSATPGRIAVIYYRELTGSDFLRRVCSWHSDMAWHLRVTVDDLDTAKKKNVRWQVGAPSPAEIALAAFGRRIDDNLKRSTLARLLPCIVDNEQIPYDLVQGAVRRVARRLGFEGLWDWEESLGVACALFKGYWIRHFSKQKQRRYLMTLEDQRTTRDYLYGRLLAYAEHIEEVAQRIAGEQRDTTAAKLMQRFADRPYSTWRTIELALTPYKARVRARYPGYLVVLLDQLDQVLSLFPSTQFIGDDRLSGEFLLGYHCQRQELKKSRDKQSPEENLLEANIVEK